MKLFSPKGLFAIAAALVMLFGGAIYQGVLEYHERNPNVEFEPREGHAAATFTWDSTNMDSIGSSNGVYSHTNKNTTTNLLELRIEDDFSSNTSWYTDTDAGAQSNISVDANGRLRFNPLRRSWLSAKFVRDLPTPTTDPDVWFDFTHTSSAGTSSASALFGFYDSVDVFINDAPNPASINFQLLHAFPGTNPSARIRGNDNSGGYASSETTLTTGQTYRMHLWKSGNTAFLNIYQNPADTSPWVSLSRTVNYGSTQFQHFIVQNWYCPSGAFPFPCTREDVSGYIDYLQHTGMQTKYPTDGNYTSPYLDSGSIGTNWNTLSWTGTTPGSTSNTLAVRTADTVADLLNATWENHTSGSGGAIPTNAEEGRYFQWKSHMQTSDYNVTPRLTRVDLGYELNHPPVVTPQTPTAAWTSDNTPTFTWTYSDDDGDVQQNYMLQVSQNAAFLTPPVYEKDTGVTPIASAATSHTFATAVGDGSYYWRVAVQDEHAAASGWSVGPDLNIDTVAPTGTISIENGAIFASNRTVNLTLTSADAGSGVQFMKIWNDADATCNSEPFPGSWVAYNAAPVHTLATGPDGVRWVCIRYRDGSLPGTSGSGIESIKYSDSIILDASAPTGTIAIEGNAPYWTSTSSAVTLDLTWNDGTGSGLWKYQLWDDASSGPGAMLDWSSWSASKSYTFSSNTRGVRTVHYRVWDNSTPSLFSEVNDTIFWDAEDPSFDNWSIEDNDLSTLNGTVSSLSVTLFYNVTDGALGSGVTDIRFGHNASDIASRSFQPIGSSQAWTLPGPFGVTNYVLVQIRDAAGNIHGENWFVDVELAKDIALDTNDIRFSANFVFPGQEIDVNISARSVGGQVPTSGERFYICVAIDSPSNLHLCSGSPGENFTGMAPSSSSPEAYEECCVRWLNFTYTVPTDRPNGPIVFFANVSVITDDSNPFNNGATRSIQVGQVRSEGASSFDISLPMITSVAALLGLAAYLLQRRRTLA